jgi:hypothetical protein
MFCAKIAPTSDETLNTILRIDAVLSGAGALIGAVAMGRLAGAPGVLNGAWGGFLMANLGIWGTIMLMGFHDLVTGRMTVSLDEVPAEADGAIDGETIEVTRRRNLLQFVQQGPPLDDTLDAPAAEAQAEEKKELELVG